MFISTLIRLGGECRVDIITSSQTFLNLVMSLSKFSQQTHLCTLSHRIHSTHSQNAFSSVHVLWVYSPWLLVCELNGSISNVPSLWGAVRKNYIGQIYKKNC